MSNSAARSAFNRITPHLARAVAVIAITTAFTLANGCARKSATAAVTPAGVLTARVAALRDSIRAVLDRAIADSAFPGAYVVVGNREGVLAEYGAGRLDVLDDTRPSASTVWDLASLTKVVGTTSAMLQLVGQGKVALDSPVVRYLPEWKASGTSRITVRMLLTHSAGLPAWRPFYKEATTADEAIAQLFATAPDTVPGTRFLYSDLGFMLLGKLVERVSGDRLDQYDAKHVFGPLGMRDTRFLPPIDWRARIAPTEQDPWRQRKLRGEVHDENASRVGGVSGHAGLFSSGRDLARFAQAYLRGGELGGTRIFDAGTLSQFTTVQNVTLSRRALGWETPTGGNSAGRQLSAQAFGHTGFTGTSLWMDPTQDLFVILLTNRVNPTRTNLKIGRVRVAVADAAASAMRANGSGGSGATPR